MKLAFTFKTAIAGLRTNKSRTVLTILGIVIGITAIIIVMALGSGAQNLILSQIQSMGSKTIAVVPGKPAQGVSDALSTFSDSIKNKDVISLEKKENAPHITKIMPIVFTPEVATYLSNTYQTTVFGVTNFFAQIYDIYPSEGRLFSDDEIQSNANVAIIGSGIKDQFFSQTDALNEKIKIKDRSFRIIGILPKKGQFSFVNFDNAVIAPYSTVQQMLGIKYFNRLVIEVDSEQNVDATVQDIKITLRNNHNITDPSKDDFSVETQAQAMQMVGTIMNVLTMFVAAVAAISLLVGGVGIMNIMLVSVTERTREIGLRKAVGATRNNILSQFLLEAVVLTGLGGIIGIILGSIFSFLTSFGLSKYLNLNWAFSFPIEGAIIGLAVSAAIGLVFGIYPARQAAKKSPMEALRYE